MFSAETAAVLSITLCLDSIDQVEEYLSAGGTLSESAHQPIKLVPIRLMSIKSPVSSFSFHRTKKVWKETILCNRHQLRPVVIGYLMREFNIGLQKRSFLVDPLVDLLVNLLVVVL